MPIFLLLVGVSGAIASQDVGEAENGIQRRTQFVGHIGQEYTLGLVGYYSLVFCRLGFLCREFQLLGAFGNLHRKCHPLLFCGGYSPRNKSPNSGGKQDQIKRISPPGFPPSRQNNHLQGTRLFIPQAIVVGGFNTKCVATRVQVGVGRRPVLRRIVPVAIEALQDIGVAVILWSSHTESRKRQGERGLVVAQGGGLRVGECFFSEETRGRRGLSCHQSGTL